MGYDKTLEDEFHVIDELSLFEVEIYDFGTEETTVKRLVVGPCTCDMSQVAKLAERCFTFEVSKCVTKITEVQGGYLLGFLVKRDDEEGRHD